MFCCSQSHTNSLAHDGSLLPQDKKGSKAEGIPDLVLRVKFAEVLLYGHETC